MTTLTNNFEGGTSGTAISTGNSGGTSGNAFDTVSIGGGATLAFSNAQSALGSLSGTVATGGGSTTAYAQWDTSLGTNAQVWWRMYLYFTALPPVSCRLWACWTESADTNQCGGMYVNTSGTFNLTQDDNSTQLTTTTVIPVNQWFRVEGYIIGNSSGTMNFNLYTTANSVVAAESHTISVNTRNPPASIAFGCTVTKANLAQFWMDGLGASNTGPLGPAGCYSFLGQVPLYYLDYLDKNTQQTLAATPGGGPYAIMPASGHPDATSAPPPDGRWSAQTKL